MDIILFEKLIKNNIDIKDIKYVFSSHAHDDYTGFLNDVLYETDAEVILHPLAVSGWIAKRTKFI